MESAEQTNGQSQRNTNRKFIAPRSFFVCKTCSLSLDCFVSPTTKLGIDPDDDGIRMTDPMSIWLTKFSVCS